MQYTNLTVNEFQQVIKVEENKLYYSDVQKIRLIKGEGVERLPLLLDCIKKQADPYTSDFKNRYGLSEAEVDRAIQFLLGSKFLLGASEHEAKPGKALKAPHVGICCGHAEFNEFIMRQFAEKKGERLSFLAAGGLLGGGMSDAAYMDKQRKLIECLELTSMLVFPSSLPNRQLALLNRVLLELKIPFLLLMFNGSEILMGPSVMPGKTPCLDCLFEHRAKALLPAGISRDMFLESRENFDLNYTVPGSLLQWVAWQAAHELRRLNGKAKPLLIKRQLHIAPEKPHAPLATEFEPITSCPSCCGLNSAKLRQGRPDAVPPEGLLAEGGEQSVRYSENGLRRAGAEASRQVLNGALNKLGLAVRIEKIGSRPIDKVIPSYVSRVSSLYSPELPFIIEERFHWGKGMTEEQAYLSGGFELLERISSEYYGDVEMFRCPYKEVKDIAMDVPARTGRVFYARNLDVFDENKPVDWVWGYSRTKDRPVLVPASMAFHTRAVFNGKFIMGTSSGLAAGATLEDAVLQGFMEAVEHDARYILQANGITMPRFVNSSFPQEISGLVDRFNQLDFEVIVRNYTLDNGIYVFRAWLVNRNDPLQYAGCGMGASLDPLVALKRAVSEAKQSWPVFPRVTSPYYAAKVNSDLYGDNTCTLFNLYQDNKVDIWPSEATLDFSSLKNESTGSVIKDIDKSCAMISEHVPDFDLVIVNLTREIFKVPVVRVIASGLQNPNQPLLNFPGDRLFEVPSKMGLTNKKLNFWEIYNDRHLQ